MSENTIRHKNTTKKVYLTRKDVLKAAAKMLRAHGYHGTSIQMIADEIGVSKSTLFNHIRSKQDMLFELINEPLQKNFPNMKKIYTQQVSSSKKLELAVTNHILDLIENIEVVTVLLLDRDYLESPYKETVMPRRKGYVQIFTHIIEDGIANGEFRHVNPKMATLAILGMCNWLIQWYNPEGGISPQEIAEMYTDYAFRILRP